MRLLINGANYFALRIKKNKRINIQKLIPEGSSVKLNFGCGLSVCNGWINIDASPNALLARWPRSLQKLSYRLTGARKHYALPQYLDILKNNIFVHYNLRYGIPANNNEVDYMYTSHFIEHLYRYEAEYLIRSAYRVLKNGGIIRIAVPDLEYALAMYSYDKERMLDKYFFVHRKGNKFAEHKYMYDYEMLSEILTGAGFSSIYRCASGEGATPDIKELDNRPDDTLFLEARK